MSEPHPQQDGTRAAGAPGRPARWMGAAVVAVAAAAFLPTLLHGFVLDDTTAIRANALVQSWRGLVSAWTHPYWAEQGGASRSGLYRPLLTAIFTVIWNAGHRFALWFHLFALAAHALAAWLVWRLLRRAVTPWLAFAGAAWFAVHPVHVEAVASVANVSEVLVAIAAAALALLVRREADRMAGDGAAVGWPAALAMALLFTGAALTKESAFVIPALAVLWVWGWRRPPAPASAAVDRPALLRRWARPLLLGAISILVLFTARRLVLGDAVGSAAMAAPGLEGLSAWQRGWVMLALGPRVLELLFWPVRLLPHYGPEVIAATGPSAAGWATLVLLGGAAAVTWTLARRGDRRPLVAVGWMTIAFLPASNLLVATGQILAERTLYGASIGAAMALAWLADRAVDTSRAFERTPRLAVRAGVACALALAALRSAAMTLEYDGTWRTNGALFQYLVAADPAGYRGHWLLALQAEQGARPDSALRELGRAYARFSGDRQLTIDYTNALLAARRPGDAARVASNLMRFADMRADSNAVGLYLSAVAQAYGADSARALARALAPSVRRGP